MTGQIIERGEEKLAVLVFLGPERGNRCYLDKPVNDAPRDVQKVLTTLLRERDLGTLVEPVKVWVGEGLETAAKTKARPRTCQGYDVSDQQVHLERRSGCH